MPRAVRARPPVDRPLAERTADAVAWLQRHASQRTRDGMARYGMPSDKAFGVTVGTMQRLAKTIGPDHDLAEALWKTGWYEARMVAAFIGEPERLTPKQMDQWCADFDNWGITDTVCFKLFDRSPHAWGRIGPWARRKEEFVRRAGFVLLACLALHDKAAEDAAFLRTLPLIERGAADDRNFVIKGVSWALRSIGGRSRPLNAAAMALAQQLAESSTAATRAMAKAALRELSSAVVARRLAAQANRRR
jgi:3-methyladenine DNA glycosylase AlkD